MRAYEFLKESTTTLNKLYNGNFPDRDESFWDEVRPHEFDNELEVKILPKHKLVIMLQSQYRVEHLDEILDMMDEDQQEILQRYMNDPNLSNKIILLSGDRIIDGNHRALAAAMKGMSINYVDLADLDEQDVAEGFDKEAGAWRDWQLKMLPRKMDMLSKLVKGWVPSEEDHIAAIEAGYDAMKETGDVKDAAKAIADTLKEIQRRQGVAEGTIGEGSIPVYKSPSQFYAGAGKTLYKLFRNAFPNLPEHVANDIYNQTSPGTNDTIVNALKQGQDPKSVFLNYYSGITFNFSKDPGTSLTPQQMKTVLLNGRWRQKILTVNPADFAEHSRNRMVKRNFGINPDEDPTRIQRQQSRAKGDGSNEPVIIIQTSNGLILWEGFHRTMSILALGKNGEDPLRWNKVKLRAWVVEIPNQQGVAEDTVDEMALKTYKTMGDFSKPGPFTGADKKLVPHPKNIEKATRFFEQTPFDFRLFFSHLKGTGKYSEHGPMSHDQIKQVFGQDSEEIINGSEDAITVVYVGNKGDSKVMLTPWMMAHRFGHAINAGARNKNWTAWGEAEKYFFQTVNNLLEEHYGKAYRGANTYRTEIKWDMTPEYNALFNAIGTQRSSTTGQIRRPYEFLYELFAQYLGTGKVTLNPLPTNLTYGRKVFGNPTKYMNIKPEYRDEGERKQAAESLAYTMELLFNDVLSDSVGKIFVM